MRKLVTLVGLLPRVHKALLGLICLILIGFSLIPSESAKASKNTAQSSVSIIDKEKKQSDKNSELKIEQKKSFPSNYKTQYFQVQSGDTLAAIFQQAGLTPRDVYDVTQLPLAKDHLLKLMPGDTLTLVTDEHGQLAQLKRVINPITTFILNKDNEQYTAKLDKKTVINQDAFAAGKIKTNFWHAAVDAGLTAAQIMELATLFGWDIDFALDLREGDSFALIYQTQTVDGKFLKNGHILAAEFTNQGDPYTAIRHTNGQYYSASGRSIQKAFLRSPVDFKYVSSNFNPKRRHPVTGNVTAHRGVDYVAPIGTPIKAAGAGKVIASSYNKLNGNYVFIKHNDTYTTKYLHLTKRKVKRGQTVKQGQIIGTLGRTGRVTGAHLHYEFIVNGVHRNPRTITLPKAAPIAKKEKNAFEKITLNMLAQLEHNKSLQLALDEN